MMNPKSLKSKLFFFWGDGMSETQLPNTSMAIAQTPYLDNLLPKGQTGFYRPVIKTGSTLPKTDIVIPYMYFISPEDFSGRAALELIDAGNPLLEGTWVGSFRISRSESSDLEQLSDAAAAGLLREMEALGTPEIIPLPFSSHKNMFAIVDKERLQVENTIRRIGAHLRLSERVLSQIEIHQFRIPESPLKEQLYFPGWGKGSLRGTFRLIGSGVNEFTPQRYFFQEYQQNMAHLQTTILKDIINTFDVLVFFIKESDSASHAGDQTLKVKAIETLDWTVGAVRPYMPPNSIVVVLADHPTDLNSPTAINAPTPYLVANVSEASFNPGFHFCEKTIKERENEQEPITMFELREKIYNLGLVGF